MNLLAARRYIRLVPFNTTTELGRSEERYRLAALSVFANVLSKGMGLMVMLLSVSLTVPYLGAERFGVWMTVASFAGLLTFLDLGVGNALTNHVAQRAAQNKADLLCQTISGGLGFLAMIGIVMATTLWLVAASIPWEVLIKVKQPELLLEARQGAMCFALLFGFNIFTSGIQRVLSGMQRAYIAHLAATVGSMAACIGLWFAAEAYAGIPILLAVMLGSQSIAALLLLGILIYRKHFSFTGIVQFTRLETPHLFRAGGLFLVLQIGTMIGWGADSLIISSTLGAVQVAIFSVTQRLFQFATQPLAMVNAPLWVAYADAHAREDKRFIRSTIKKSMTFTCMGAILGAAFILIVSSWVIDRWTNGEIITPLAFIVVYSVWIIIESCGNSFAMFLNGTGIIKQQVAVVFLFVLLVLPLKIVLIKKMGLLGIPLAAIIAYLISHVGLYAFFFQKEIRKKIF